jgi:hypothetical protein
MTNADLYAAFKAHTEGATTFTRRMAINIADFFDTSPRRIVQQLERLWILKEGSWDWFQANGGITKAHVEECRARLASTERSGNDSP